MASRILVVDDEPAIRETMRMILEYEGYECLTAGSGAEGLTAVEKDAPDLVFLQSTEELHLQGQRHLSDLVEEQRALVGGLEQARTVLDSAGERTTCVTKQLALKERVRERAAVDWDERSARPW